MGRQIKALVGVLLVLLIVVGVGGWWLHQRNDLRAARDEYTEAWTSYSAAWDGLQADLAEAEKIAVDCPADTRHNTVCDRLSEAVAGALALERLPEVDVAAVDQDELESQLALVSTGTEKVSQAHDRVIKERESARSEVTRAARDWVNNELKPRLTWAKEDVKNARAVVLASEGKVTDDGIRSFATAKADELEAFVAQTEEMLGGLTITEGIDYLTSLGLLMDECKSAAAAVNVAAAQKSLGIFDAHE